MLKKLSYLLRSNPQTVIALALLFPIYFVLYKFYIPHINAFGCFDDCNNFIGGYFLLQGKRMFSDFFFNHQPLAGYISYAIQLVSSPQNVFELILRHRQFILLLGLLFNALLILRFGAKVLIFIMLFEFSKFYIFGDRFLSEGMIIYPLIYTAGVIYLKLYKHKPLVIDYVLAAIFAWFVIFSREPYVPLALFLYVVLLWGKPFTGLKKFSLFLFMVLSLATIFYHDIGEFFFNVVTVNQQAVIGADFTPNGLPGHRVIQSIFYPIYILFYGKWNIFKQLLVGIDIVFLVLLIKLIKDKAYKQALFVIATLALANIRVVSPGSLFYASFHMIVWYGLMIFMTVLIMFQQVKNKAIFAMAGIILAVSFTLLVSSSSYFIKDKVDQHTELLTNYGPVMQQGEVIKLLSKPTDTLFLDGSEDLIYWQAQRLSPYKYSWYTSAMLFFPKYNDERNKMFKETPPDFYREYGTCPKDPQSTTPSLPKDIAHDYLRLNENGKPSCIFVKKEKLKSITKDQWENARQRLYTIPSDEKNTEQN